MLICWTICVGARVNVRAANLGTVRSPKYHEVKYHRSLKYHGLGVRRVDFLSFGENHFAEVFSISLKFNMSGAKRKARVSLTNEVKLNAVRDVEAGKKSQQQAADALGVDRSTVSQWMKKKPKLLDQVAAGKGVNKTMHKEQFPLVSKALLTYLTARSNLNAPAPGLTSYSLMSAKCKALAAALVSQGSKDYAEFKASKGWLREVMARSGYGRIQLHGRWDCFIYKGHYYLFSFSGSGGDINPQEADKLMTDFRKQIEATGLVNPKALFNADETGLFYK